MESPNKRIVLEHEAPDQPSSGECGWCGTRVDGRGQHHARKCAHCGYLYCRDCCHEEVMCMSSHKSLWSGKEKWSQHAVHVCGYCLENLKMTACTEEELNGQPSLALVEYLSAYGLLPDEILTKADIVTLALAAVVQRHMSPARVDWYRTYTLPRQQAERRALGYGGAPCQCLACRGQPRSRELSVPHTSGSDGITSRSSLPVVPPTPTMDELIQMQIPIVRRLDPIELWDLLVDNDVSEGVLYNEFKARRVVSLKDALREKIILRGILYYWDRATSQEHPISTLIGQLSNTSHYPIFTTRSQAMLTEEEEEDFQRAWAESRKTYEQEEAARAGHPGRARDHLDPPGRKDEIAEHEDGRCIVCMDAEATIAVSTCGHMALCKPCSEKIMKSTHQCPLCRTNITSEERLIRIYRT